MSLALIPVSGAQAAVLGCPTWFGTLVGRSQSRRAREARIRDGLERIRNQNYAMANGSARHLSASQAELVKSTMVIDAYFYIGDIKPLINRFDGAIRAVEDSMLRRKINLSLIDQLEKHKPLEHLETERASLVREFEQAGLFDDERLNAGLDDHSKWILEHGSADEVELLLNQTLRALKAQNKYYEILIGRNFQLYKIVREHLDKLMGADDKFLLEVLAHTDSRGVERALSFGLESLEKPRAAATTAPAPDTASLLEAKRKEKEEQVKRRLESIDANIKQVKDWIATVRSNGQNAENGKTVDYNELRRYLDAAGYLDDDLATILADGVKTDEGRKLLVRHLELLQARLRDAHSLVELAHKLDDTLGLKSGDFENFRSLLPDDKLRPTVKEVENVFYHSTDALRADLLRNWRRQIFSIVDSYLFYGGFGSAVPTIGRAANVLTLFKSEAPRNFVYGLFQDLYLQHVVNQHYPALNLLKRAPGDPEKKADLLENLNAGTKDELLLTFARRADMKNTWEVIKEVAKKKQGNDHLQLYERMLQAEERGRALGTISIIDQSSYSRYIVASLVNGGLYWAGKKWVVPLFAGQPAATADDDDKKKKKKGDEPPAPESAKPTTPAPKGEKPPQDATPAPAQPLVSADERMQERALKDVTYLVQAAYPESSPTPVDPDQVRAATYDLMALEGSLSGHPLTAE